MSAQESSALVISSNQLASIDTCTRFREKHTQIFDTKDAAKSALYSTVADCCLLLLFLAALHLPLILS